MKLEVAIKSWNALNSLFEKELPISASFNVERLISMLEQPIMSYERRRIELLEKYGEKKDDGSYEVSGELLGELDSKFKELVDVDIDINIPEITIPLSSDLKLSAKDIRVLKEFVKFE